MNLSLVIVLLTAILVQQVSSSQSIGTKDNWISFLDKLLTETDPETNPHEWTPINFDLRAYRRTPTALKGIEFQITNAHRNTKPGSKDGDRVYQFIVQSQFKMIENKNLKGDSVTLKKKALIEFYDFLNHEKLWHPHLIKSVDFDSEGVLQVYVPAAMETHSDSESQSDFVTRFKYFYKRDDLSDPKQMIFEFNIILTRDGSTQITVYKVDEFERNKRERAVYSEKQRGNRFTAKIGTGETSTTLLFTAENRGTNPKSLLNTERHAKSAAASTNMEIQPEEQIPIVAKAEIKIIKIENKDQWTTFFNSVIDERNPKPANFTFTAYVSPEHRHGYQLEIPNAYFLKTTYTQNRGGIPINTFTVPSYEFSMIGDTNNSDNISAFREFIGGEIVLKSNGNEYPNTAAELTVEYPIAEDEVTKAIIVFGPANRNEYGLQPWTVTIEMTFNNKNRTVSIEMERVKFNPKVEYKSSNAANKVEYKSSKAANKLTVPESAAPTTTQIAAAT